MIETKKRSHVVMAPPLSRLPTRVQLPDPDVAMRSNIDGIEVYRSDDPPIGNNIIVNRPTASAGKELIGWR